MARTGVSSGQYRKNAIAAGWTKTTVTGYSTGYPSSTAYDLDVYDPKTGSNLVVVTLHGGAWNKAGVGTGARAGQDRNTDGWVGIPQAIASQGVCVINADYPCVATSPGNTDTEYRKTTAGDGMAGFIHGNLMPWVRSNAATYHGDPNRVVLFGASTGGHIALMAAIKGTLGSTRPDAIVVWSPPTHLDQHDPALNPGITNFLVVTDPRSGADQVIAQAASPYNQITNTFGIPLLIVGDTLDPLNFAPDFTDLNTQAGNLGLDTTLISTSFGLHADFRGLPTAGVGRMLHWASDKLTPPAVSNRSSAGSRTSAGTRAAA